MNTTLGQTWAEKGEAPPYKNLYNRREQYKTNHVPADVCFLTAGVDVQRDRLELEIGRLVCRQTQLFDRLPRNRGGARPEPPYGTIWQPSWVNGGRARTGWSFLSE